MKKRILSVILTVVMTFSLSIAAFAAEPDNDVSLLDKKIASFVEAKIATIEAKITVDQVKTLSDLAGNEYKLIECKPTGYFIIHPESGILVEYAVDAKSPYEGIDSDLYYGGPTYYYVKSEGNFVHTVLGTTIDNDKLEAAVQDCDIFNDELVSQTNDRNAQYFKGKSNDFEIYAATASDIS